MQDIDKRHVAVASSNTFRRIRDCFSLGERRVLDLGCAYGEHLAFFGKGSVGMTVSREEADYGKENGYQVVRGNVEDIDSVFSEGVFEVIWANNIFEHLLAPHTFLMRLKGSVVTEGLLILGVPVVPRIVSLLRISRFRGALSSAHTNFFTRETLRLTVERGGWQVKDMRPFITTIAPVDRFLGLFAPHIYVVAVNDSMFTYSDKKRAEWADDSRYDELLKMGVRDTQSISQ